MKDGLEDKIDRLAVMMSQLATKDEETNERFKSQIYQGKKEDKQKIIEMTIMKEVGVGLEKGHIQVILERMTEAIASVGQGQDQEQVLIETEFGVISIANMII